MITGRPHLVASGLKVSIDGSGNIILTDPSNSNSISLSGNLASRFFDGVLGCEIVGDLNPSGGGGTADFNMLLDEAMVLMGGM